VKKVKTMRTKLVKSSTKKKQKDACHNKTLEILKMFEDIMDDRLLDEKERREITRKVTELYDIVEEDGIIDSDEEEALDVIKEALEYVIKMDKTTRYEDPDKTLPKGTAGYVK